jgi:hypothetical protein
MKARRVDGNLKLIVAAFRKLGCSVHVTNGAWDLTVGLGGMTRLVEVKDGSKPPSARKLTPAQVEFRRTWTGGIELVESVEHVASVVNAMRAQWAAR